MAHGMGDPRGGEFREATVANRRDEGGKPVVVRGWVFKGKKPSIVTTAGLVYDVAKIGPLLDVAKDVQAQKDARRLPDGRWYSNGDWDVLYATVLLVAGRTDLAEGLARDASGRRTLTGFLGAWLTQAVEAHEQGDDALALRAARGVADQRSAFESEAGRNGPPSNMDGSFDFARIAPDLAADAARRSAHSRPPIDLVRLRQRPVSERIAPLIERLDDVTTRGRLDGVAIVETDPLVQELVLIGDPAVPSLLETIEHDARLARAANQRTVSSIAYRPVAVREVAYAAIQGIMQVRSLPPMKDLPGLRAVWEANRTLTPAERWFRILSDDGAGVIPWSEAENSLFGDGTSFPRPNPLPAEALRPTRNASVREVLARRAKDLAAQIKGDRGMSGFDLELALRLATDLALWAPEEALPTLRVVTDRAMSPDIPTGRLQGSFALAMVARGDLEGTSAWNVYAKWVRQIRADPDPGYTEALRPLLERRNVPELREAAPTVLASPESPWSIPQGARTVRRFSWLQQYLLSPLLDDPMFLKSVPSALDDTTIVGDVTVEGNMVSFESDRGLYGRSDAGVAKDPLRPPSHQKVPVRACDQVATALARLKEAPTYRPYWPEAKRDEAIAALKAFLQSHAGKLASLLPEPDFTGNR